LAQVPRLPKTAANEEQGAYLLKRSVHDIWCPSGRAGSNPSRFLRELPFPQKAGEQKHKKKLLTEASASPKGFRQL